MDSITASTCAILLLSGALLYELLWRLFTAMQATLPSLQRLLLRSALASPPLTASQPFSSFSKNSSLGYKMVLCVRSDIGMGKGKAAAQCAHAALGAYRRAMKSKEQFVRHWMQQGEGKIVLKIPDEDEMLTLYGKAMSLDLPAYIVSDAGHTQIPAGTSTVLAVGPGPKDIIDKLTGHLKLL